MVSIACFPRARIGGKLVIFIYKKNKTKQKIRLMEPSVGFSWILEPNLLQVEMGWTVGSSLPPWALWVMEAIATPSWLYSSMACSYIEQHSRVSYVFKGPRLKITP